MMDFEIKAALVARYGTQTAAVRVFKAAGCRTMSEGRLSRLLHGWDLPTPEEIRVFREKLGVELKPRPAPDAA